jgi:hypothetical protein
VAIIVAATNIPQREQRVIKAQVSTNTTGTSSGKEKK